MPPRFEAHPEHLGLMRSAALEAVEPAHAVRQALRPEDLAACARVFIVGAGKAGVAMALAAADLAGARLAGGVMAVPAALLPTLSTPVTFIAGGHPLPTAGSLAAGDAIAALLAHTRPDDLVLALISGGGSALLEWARVGLSLEDLRRTNAELLRCGATIHEVNAVRQQLSRLKGGGLLELAAPARVLGLILSDVVGNPLEVIASGLTVAHPAPREVGALVARYGLERTLPPAVLRALAAPRPPSVAGVVENRLIGSNRRAGEAAARAAQALGFEARVLADDWQGEAREMGRRFAEAVCAAPPSAPQALIVGGESTVTVRGPGRGGRNQEVALAAALALEGRPNVVVSTFATDGVDGPTDAAGATVTGGTAAQARARGLDPADSLARNDTYAFFAAAGGLVRTGPTGTNVNDLTFGLTYGGGQIAYNPADSSPDP